MEQEIITITFWDKLCIVTNWGLKILGLLTISLLIYVARFGLPSVIKSVELSELNQRVDDLGLAMSEVQEVQVAWAKKGKIVIAKNGG